MAKTKDILPDFNPAPTERKVVKKAETVQSKMAKGKKKTVEVEHEPLKGYTCIITNKVNYIDDWSQMPPSRISPEGAEMIRKAAGQ